MARQISITMRDWVFDEILADKKNRSEWIEELLVKSYMAEKEQKILKNKKDSILDKAPVVYSRIINSIKNVFRSSLEALSFDEFLLTHTS